MVTLCVVRPLFYLDLVSGRERPLFLLSARAACACVHVCNYRILLCCCPWGRRVNAEGDGALGYEPITEDVSNLCVFNVWHMTA